MLMTLLTSCSSVPAYIHTCPVPREYSRDYKETLKAEVSQLPSNSEILDVIKDYSVLVQQSKDCWSK